MKKKLFLLFALTVLTFGCSDVSEDTMPDPVVPEINIDDAKGETDEDTRKDKKKVISTIRKKV